MEYIIQGKDQNKNPLQNNLQGRLKESSSLTEEANLLKYNGNKMAMV